MTDNRLKIFANYLRSIFNGKIDEKSLYKVQMSHRKINISEDKFEAFKNQVMVTLKQYSIKEVYLEIISQNIQAIKQAIINF